MKVVLAFDADDAGMAAAEAAATVISRYLTSWGTPRDIGPSAQALARAQQEYDKAARRWATLDTIAARVPSPALLDMREEAHEALEQVAEYVLHLLDRQGDDRPYLTARTAEEFEALLRPRPVVQDVRTRTDWASIKQRTDLADFAQRFTELRQRGRSLRGKCPLPDHQDDSPSFHVYPAERNWYCYGCHRWGDIFDLAKALDIPLRELSAL